MQPVAILADIEQLELAVELLRRKARISIVHHQMGVSRSRLRALYREIHGRGAPSGQIQMIGGVAIQSRAQQIHAGFFAALYEHYAGPAMSRQLYIRAVIAAHDFYVSLVLHEPLVDFNGAWVIARDLRVGMSELRSCNVCEVRYLISSESRLAPTCPFCVLHSRRSGRSEPCLVLPAELAAPAADARITALPTPPDEDR
jgi:hypothetical protein